MHFKGGRDGTIWYYRAVMGALTEAAKPEERQLNALIEEIGFTLSLLEEAIAERSRGKIQRNLPSCTGT